MVAPDQVNTWLQSRIDAQDEKIESLTNQVKDLSVSINSMKEILNELPKSIEKLTMGYRKSLGKQFVYEEEAEGSSFKERTVTDDYESSQKTPNRKYGGPEDEDDENLFKESTTTGENGSGTKTPFQGLDSFFRGNHFESPLFSMPKVKLPLFEGIDPRGWNTKAELYFQVHQTPSPQKLKLTQMCMNGSALNWFTYLLIKHPQTTWEQFREKLLVRFGGTGFHNAHETLGYLYQDGDIDEYIENFEALSALIPDQSEDQGVGMFLRGLQNDIRNWVRALQPRTCDHAMDLARHVAIATAIHGDKTNTRGKTSFNNGTGGLNFSWKYAQDLIELLDRPNFTNSTLTNCQQIQLDTNLPQFSLLIQYPQGLPMSKISVIHDWPIPQNAKVVRESPDLTGHHRGFIKDRGKMVALKKLLGRMQPSLNIGSMISGLRTSLLFKTAALIENVPLAQAQAHILD